jgi:formamidopyrimidine-DNA glycosylase
MPELPEVEVTRRGLLPHVTGRRIVSVTVRHHGLRWPVEAGLADRLRGCMTGALSRRGKYLLLECQSATQNGWLMIHLGMTGTLRIYSDVAEPGPHDHVDVVLEGDAGILTLRFRDPRRFGAVLWVDSDEAALDTHPLLARLGIEPFDPAFSGHWLFRQSRGRQVAIKQMLLGGQVVVGVGNIYASESLFRAGIRPTTPAGRISLARYTRLAEAIRATLSDAIELGGSTLRDFIGSDGSSGYFQLQAFVYDRTGEPCRVCETPIRQIVQGQRSTFFCPVCQR